MVTRVAAEAKAGGTMRIKSGLPFPQWAEAVSRNIKNSARRRGMSQLLRAGTPNPPT